MHDHGVAHLDISLGNILTDCEGNYIYIDFETSRRYDRSIRLPRISGCRGTEIPPDVEGGEESCPFKIDVFALGVLFLRACKVRKTASENFLHCIFFFLTSLYVIWFFSVLSFADSAYRVRHSRDRRTHHPNAQSVT